MIDKNEDYQKTFGFKLDYSIKRMVLLKDRFMFI